ncbi:hypothetical protein TeGR_g8848 [Tetraparma gracilis]|uniref:Methyltransferase domain-containing protein n=1 Tax=Tetraparma gracilis TaxID=2962635 RepID=A0ABQ6MCC1_9STRA|nr:hypothetical protein TeGR_g8848 [Tetraparma gracilis]
MRSFTFTTTNAVVALVCLLCLLSARDLMLSGSAAPCQPIRPTSVELQAPPPQASQPVVATQPGFSKAFAESNGFFNDISDADWDLQRFRYHKTDHKGDGTLSVKRDTLQSYYQNNWEPSFTCQHELRLGGMGDGPKWICDPHRIKGVKDCLIYSFGSNNEFDFEESVYNQISTECEIHTFDFLSLEQSFNKPSYVNYHAYGLGKQDRVFGAQMQNQEYTLPSIVKMLGHEGRSIEIFKIDCEGCELEAGMVQSWLNAGVNLRQLQVEVHGQSPDPDSIAKLQTFFKAVTDAGHVIFHKEANILAEGKCVEFAFLQLAPAFFVP